MQDCIAALGNFLNSPITAANLLHYARRIEEEVGPYRLALTSGQPACLLDERGYFVDANAKMLELTGYDLESLRASHCSQLWDQPLPSPQLGSIICPLTRRNGERLAILTVWFKQGAFTTLMVVGTIFGDSPSLTLLPFPVERASVAT